MPRDYDDLADAMDESDALDPDDVTDREIQSRIRDFANTSDHPPGSESDLLSEVSDRLKEDRVGFTSAEGRDTGGNLGKRKNITTWEDRWGNVMGRNTNTGTARKIVDSSDR